MSAPLHAWPAGDAAVRADNRDPAMRMRLCVVLLDEEIITVFQTFKRCQVVIVFTSASKQSNQGPCKSARRRRSKYVVKACVSSLCVCVGGRVSRLPECHGHTEKKKEGTLSSS